MTTITELLTMAEACEVDADKALTENRFDTFKVLSLRAIRLYTRAEKISETRAEARRSKAFVKGR